MIGFTLKKSFFDMWDNLFKIILINLGFWVLIVGFVSLCYVSSKITVLFFILLSIGVIAVSIYTGATNLLAADIADYEKPGFKDFFKYLKQSIVPGLIFAGIIAVLSVLFVVSFNYYSSIKNTWGFFASAILFWVGIIAFFSLTLFFPIVARLDKRPISIIKKCFIIFMDNAFFIILVTFFISILVFVLSVFVGFMFPGYAGVMLLWNVAFKLRLYKYDYLEEHPEEKKRKIPWDKLLIKDREMVGKRTLRGFIFPWKE
jgi:hypothetical protein